MNYLEKLKDPMWQKKRLEIFKRDGWVCKYCGDINSTLHVHHLRYRSNIDPWEYSNDDLKTLCEYCHGVEKDYRHATETVLLDILKPYSVIQICELGAALRATGIPKYLSALGSKELEVYHNGETR